MVHGRNIPSASNRAPAPRRRHRPARPHRAHLPPPPARPGLQGRGPEGTPATGRHRPGGPRRRRPGAASAARAGLPVRTASQRRPAPGCRADRPRRRVLHHQQALGRVRHLDQRLLHHPGPARPRAGRRRAPLPPDHPAVRRRLAWFIARRPGGAIVGPCSTAASPFTCSKATRAPATPDSDEVETEQALARRRFLADLATGEDRIALTGPAAAPTPLRVVARPAAHGRCGLLCRQPATAEPSGTARSRRRRAPSRAAGGSPGGQAGTAGETTSRGLACDAMDTLPRHGRRGRCR